jgi:hypothetical protein
MNPGIILTLLGKNTFRFLLENITFLSQASEHMVLGLYMCLACARSCV